MKFILLAICLLCEASLAAAQQPACINAAFSEVRSLQGLPIEINHLLGRGRRGPEGIADRGEKFDSTDVVDSSGLPMHHFIIGGISPECAIVAVGVGGWGFQVIEFSKRNVWRPAEEWSLTAEPRSLQDLVAISKSPAGQNQLHAHVPRDGFVPDGTAAIKVAEAAWLPIYGVDIYKAKPFTAKPQGDIWVVVGTLSKDAVGGAPYAEISRKNGQIIRVSHGQ